MTGVVTLRAADLPQTAVEEFTAAWTAMPNHADHLRFWEAVDRMQRGWTAAAVHQVDRLADHAVTVGAFVGQGSRFDGAAFPSEVRHGLFAVADAAAHGIAMEFVLGWLEILASETDVERHHWLSDTLAPALSWTTSTREDRANQGRLWRARGGPLAPLAWAAGLSLDEVTAHRESSNVQVWRAMAALRGYRLPAGGILPG